MVDDLERVARCRSRNAPSVMLAPGVVHSSSPDESCTPTLYARIPIASVRVMVTGTETHGVAVEMHPPGEMAEIRLGVGSKTKLAAIV